MSAISTELRQWCEFCGEATLTGLCRRYGPRLRYGPPWRCCTRHCCPPGYPSDLKTVILSDESATGKD